MNEFSDVAGKLFPRQRTKFYLTREPAGTRRESATQHPGSQFRAIRGGKIAACSPALRGIQEGHAARVHEMGGRLKEWKSEAFPIRPPK
ncbi:hypothetical protein [Paraburkholderia dokdonensis]|uniref:hypothetical protein n=1 Tax=Paraburkholderia dokdonensis TaxID=2211211 RepID=UPI00135894D1|nr:hypothetical protein [Paraburkholderia dokdonensis]